MEWSSQICHKVINNIDLKKAVWVYEYFLSSEIWFMKSKIEITPRNILSEKVVCVQVLTYHKQSIFVWECLFVIGLLLRKDVEFKWTAKPSDTSIIKSLLNIWRAQALYKSRRSLLFFYFELTKDDPIPSQGQKQNKEPSYLHMYFPCHMAR